jgi:hypothetical protein
MLPRNRPDETQDLPLAEQAFRLWPSTTRSLYTNDAMVKANTKPAAVTTPPVPAIARMMPVFKPAPISSLKRDINSRL